MYPDTRCNVRFTRVRSLQVVYCNVCIDNQENINENLQQKRLVTVWFCYYGNIGWSLLTFVIQNFIKTFHFMVKLRVTGTCSTCWKYDHLLLINFLMMAPLCQNKYQLAPNIKCFKMFYCILISAFC
jgi:hypothetical protein